MKCMNCENEAEGKSKYCSGKCKTDYNRHKIDTEPTQIQTDTASCRHYQDNPDMYATREDPAKLNWGAWMTSEQLANAGLKANRVTIPGDWDYRGVCEQVDGVWQVQEQPTPDVGKLSDAQLQLAIKYTPGANWFGSPENTEVVRRRNKVTA